jgi:hypothetical protein
MYKFSSVLDGWDENITVVRFRVITAVKINIVILWVMTPCSRLIDEYQHYSTFRVEHRRPQYAPYIIHYIVYYYRMVFCQLYRTLLCG